MKATVRRRPFHLEPEVSAMLAEASERTGLCHADLISQALRRALPQIVRANVKPPGLPAKNLAPLTKAEWDEISRAWKKRSSRERAEDKAFARASVILYPED
jgi:hypothetical protein